MRTAFFSGTEDQQSFVEGLSAGLRSRNSGALSFALLVADKFDANHQAFAAHITDNLCFAGQSRICCRINSPICAAFAMYSCSSSAIVASDAAIATGLPPNVEACAPGFQVMMFAFAIVALKGMPDAIPFVQIMSGSIPA